MHQPQCSEGAFGSEHPLFSTQHQSAPVANSLQGVVQDDPGIAFGSLEFPQLGADTGHSPIGPVTHTKIEKHISEKRKLKKIFNI